MSDGFIRNPRIAFNAAEADCCTCVGKCDRRADGVCRCLPEHSCSAPQAAAEGASPE